MLRSQVVAFLGDTKNINDWRLVSDLRDGSLHDESLEIIGPVGKEVL